MNTQIKPRKYYDDVIEPDFVMNYSEFALQINFNSVVALLEKTYIEKDPIKIKCICLNGIQLLYSSLEDFSILLHALINKKNGFQLHCSIGVDIKTREGSTFVPNKLKEFKSIQGVLDILGFNNIDVGNILNQTNLTRNDLENYFREIAKSVKKIGKYQDEINESKNMFKHGKAFLNEADDKVIFLKWKRTKNMDELKRVMLPVSIQELRQAAIRIWEIYKLSLDLLWLFFLNYYPDKKDVFREQINKQSLKNDEIVLKLKNGLIKTGGISE